MDSIVRPCRIQVFMYEIFILNSIYSYNIVIKVNNNLPTINVTPVPAKLSDRSLVSLLSRYGMWPFRFLGSLRDAMQYPE